MTAETATTEESVSQPTGNDRKKASDYKQAASFRIVPLTEITGSGGNAANRIPALKALGYVMFANEADGEIDSDKVLWDMLVNGDDKQRSAAVKLMDKHCEDITVDAGTFRTLGQLQAARGRLTHAGVQLIAGHRRALCVAYNAAKDNKKASTVSMKIEIVKATNEQVSLESVVENQARRAIARVDLSKHIAQQMKEPGVTMASLAEKYGVAPSTIRLWKDVGEAPEPVQDAIASGDATMLEGQEAKRKAENQGTSATEELEQIKEDKKTGKRAKQSTPRRLLPFGEVLNMYYEMDDEEEMTGRDVRKLLAKIMKKKFQECEKLRKAHLVKLAEDELE